MPTEDREDSYAAFHATLGVKLADALAGSSHHVALNQMSAYGVYPIVHAERRPDGKVVACLYQFEGEYRNIIADTTADLDAALFADAEGYWPGPEHWYPDDEPVVADPRALARVSVPAPESTPADVAPDPSDHAGSVAPAGTIYSAWCPICESKHNRPADQLTHPRERACHVCGEVLPLSAFARSNGSWDGHRKTCLACEAAQKAQVARVAAPIRAAPVTRPATSDRYGSFAAMTADDVARWARSALRRPTLRILDTETTGRGPKWGGGVDELVELCILDGTGAVRLNTLVRPQGTMHPDATALSGITDALLAEAAPFSAIAARVRDELQGQDVLIFNVDYDQPLLDVAFAACEQVAPTYTARCAMRAYHKFSGRAAQDRWVGLEAACRAEGIMPQGPAHRALADCLSTLALLRRMAERAQGGR